MKPNHVREQPLPFQRPLVATAGKFVVMVRADRQPDGSPGRYEVSNQTFDTFDEARSYAAGCSFSRAPVVALLVSAP